MPKPAARPCSPGNASRQVLAAAATSSAAFHGSCSISASLWELSDLGSNHRCTGSPQSRGWRCLPCALRHPLLRPAHPQHGMLRPPVPCCEFLFPPRPLRGKQQVVLLVPTHIGSQQHPSAFPLGHSNNTNRDQAAPIAAPSLKDSPRWDLSCTASLPTSRGGSAKRQTRLQGDGYSACPPAAQPRASDPWDRRAACGRTVLKWHGAALAVPGAPPIRRPPALPRAGEARSRTPAGVQPNAAWNHVQVTMATAHASGKAKIWANCKCK